MPVEGGLSRIHQISMRAHDVERAVRFYRDVLGVPFLFAAPPNLAFFDCAGVRLMLSTPEPGFDHPGSVLYFAVDDIHHGRSGTRLARRCVPHGASQDRDAQGPGGVARGFQGQ